MNAQQMETIQRLTRRLDRNSRWHDGSPKCGELSFTAEPLCNGAIMVTASNTETRDYLTDWRCYFLATIGVRGGIKIKQHQGKIY